MNYLVIWVRRQRGREPAAAGAEGGEGREREKNLALYHVETLNPNTVLGVVLID